MLSVVIPAHNEASVIERCLTSLQQGLDGCEVQIIVVCNGCKDNTAALASRFDDVEVVELDTPSKVLALNTGDALSSGFPVAYVDADIVVSGKDLLWAAEALNRPNIHIVAPELDVVLNKSSFWVKAFYSVWTRLPYFSDRRMVGSGIYILSEQGRSRFTRFPELIADDGFVRALFQQHERLTVSGCSFKIFAPRTLKDLIKIKSRVRFGNLELGKKYPNLKLGGENKPGAFIRLILRRPHLVLNGLIYAYVQWQTKLNSRRRFAESDFSTWERDESSRLQ